MLSLSKVKGAAHAESYYKSVNDYYSGDKDKDQERDEEGNLADDNGEHIRSAFIGAGAKLLGLEDGFSKSQFSELLRGDVGGGPDFGRPSKDGSIRHAPGWDATFSAPKSVSIMALVAGDTRIIDAHHRAIDVAVKYMEDNVAITRDGAGKWVKSDNLVAAAFTHSASRNLDPQLHTHTVLMNMTSCKDGKWRALVSEKLYERKKLIGAIYRAELAHELKHSLGYELESRAEGFFDIKGVSKALIKKMSSRRAEIEAVAKQKGLEDAMGHERAALMTRSVKQYASAKTLADQWEVLAGDHLPDLRNLIPSHAAEQEIEAAHNDNQTPAGLVVPASPAGVEVPASPAGVEVPASPAGVEVPASLGIGRGDSGQPDFAIDPHQQTLDDPVKEKGVVQANGALQGNIRPVGRGFAEREAALTDIKLAIQHLTTFEAVIKEADIYKFALTYIDGRHTFSDLQEALQGELQSGSLVRSLVDGDSLTTKKAHRQESLAVAMMQQGIGGHKAVMSKTKLSRHLKSLRAHAEQTGNHYLSAEQEQGATAILTSKDQFIGVQGSAGTGKTLMWEQINKVALSNGYFIRGFAPTGSAAEKLGIDAGFESGTVDSFLFKHDKVLNGKEKLSAKKEVWVLDEAGISNANQFINLMMLARKSGAKLVFQGDIKQHSSIEWGKFFKILQDQGMPTVAITDIRRQKQRDVKEAVYAVLDKDWQKVESLMGDRFVQTKYRVDALVNDWQALDKESRDNALIVIPDLITKDKVNSKIREFKMENGEISANEFFLPTLKVRQEISDPLKGDGHFYNEKDIVQFNKAFHAQGINAGERFTVVKSGVRNRVLLRGEDGRSVTFDPTAGGSGRFALDIFTENKQGFSSGDKIVWRKANKEKLLKNGDRGMIQKIDKETMTMEVAFTKSGVTTVKTLDLKRDLTFEHDYVKTAFISQGLDSHNVFTIAESFRKNLVNQKSFYVQLSRTKDNVTVYTDNTSKLMAALRSRDGEKTSALESQKNRQLEIGKQQTQDSLGLSWLKKVLSLKTKEPKAPDKTPVQSEIKKERSEPQPEHFTKGFESHIDLER